VFELLLVFKYFSNKKSRNPKTWFIIRASISKKKGPPGQVDRKGFLLVNEVDVPH
jgi:hypothetical protein